MHQHGFAEGGRRDGRFPDHSCEVGVLVRLLQAGRGAVHDPDVGELELRRADRAAAGPDAVGEGEPDLEGAAGHDVRLVAAADLHQARPPVGRRDRDRGVRLAGVDVGAAELPSGGAVAAPDAHIEPTARHPLEVEVELRRDAVDGAAKGAGAGAPDDVRVDAVIIVARGSVAPGHAEGVARGLGDAEIGIDLRHGRGGHAVGVGARRGRVQSGDLRHQPPARRRPAPDRHLVGGERREVLGLRVAAGALHRRRRDSRADTRTYTSS